MVLNPEWISWWFYLCIYTLRAEQVWTPLCLTCCRNDLPAAWLWETFGPISPKSSVFPSDRSVTQHIRGSGGGNDKTWRQRVGDKWRAGGWERVCLGCDACTYSKWSLYIRGKLLVFNETMWDWEGSVIYSKKILGGLIPRGQLFFFPPWYQVSGFFFSSSRGFVLSQSCTLLLLNKWIHSSYFGIQAKATQFFFFFLKGGACLQNQTTNENVFTSWLLM